MAQNIENIDFSTFLWEFHNNGFCWSKNVIFEFLGTFLTISIHDTLSKIALFYEKMYKVFKNKAQGCLSRGCSDILHYDRSHNLRYEAWGFMYSYRGCFTIRVYFKKLHSSPVLTVKAYFDFKVLLPKHWSGLGLPTAIKRRLESINFSKKYAHS